MISDSFREFYMGDLGIFEAPIKVSILSTRYQDKDSILFVNSISSVSL